MRIGLKALLVPAAIGLAFAATAVRAAADEKMMVVPAPMMDESAAMATTEVAVFAGGCFWGVQGVFQHVNGVISAVSGYTGGEKRTAEYDVVGGGRSGHAESVEITYDPRVITYGKLLQIFFSVAHDGTELNRQGPDTGTQYRSAIFPMNAEQATIAKAYIDQLNGAHIYKRALATTIEPGKTFYRAEEYHQDFLTLNPTHGYIVYNDLPKVEALKKLFPAAYRAKPVLVFSGKDAFTSRTPFPPPEG